jgi:hypothetical protein
VTANCTSCHDGNTADGKHEAHISTSSECDACHSTVAWIPANFDHEGVTGSCSSCHDGIKATGKSSTHFISSRECDYCHDNNFWTPLFFSHHSAGYPGDHSQQLLCTDCHGGNSEIATWSSPQFQPDCASCHATDFDDSHHKKYVDPDTFYSVGELHDCTGSCHVYTDSTLTQIKESEPGPEHRVTDGDF